MYLPEEICRGILKIRVNGRENTEDVIAWNHPKEIDFSVKSAYKIITMEDQLDEECH